MLQVVVLAGGRGTRMRPFTDEMPKALVPVAGRPFVHHQLALLARQAVTDVVMSIGYRGDMIRAAVGDGRAFGLRVRYVDEGTDLRGHGGGAAAVSRRGCPRRPLPGPLRRLVSAHRAGARRGRRSVARGARRWSRSCATRAAGTAATSLELASSFTTSARPTPTCATSTTGSACSARGGPPRARRVRAPTSPTSTGPHVGGRAGGLEVAQRFYEIGSPRDCATWRRSCSCNRASRERVHERIGPSRFVAAR